MLLAMHWTGDDADRFGQSWATARTRLAEAAELLDTYGGRARTQAAEQEAGSAGATGGGPPSSAGPRLPMTPPLAAADLYDELEDMTPQERADLTALSARVDNMAWAVALTRPAATAVTESMLYAEDRARVVQEHALSEQISPRLPPADLTPVELTPLATDLTRAAEVGSHLQVAASDSLRSAEVAVEHSELVSEAAHSRMALQQQRDLPGEARGMDPVGPQW